MTEMTPVELIAALRSLFVTRDETGGTRTSATPAWYNTFDFIWPPNAPVFENGFQAPVGEGRAIYSNRMTGEYDADYGKALAAFRANFPALSEAYDYCVIDPPAAYSLQSVH